MAQGHSCSTMMALCLDQGILAAPRDTTSKHSKDLPANRGENIN